MDLQRIRQSLASEQNAIDLRAALQQYRDAGGADDDEAAFLRWLADDARTLDSARTLADLPVEVSQIFPARFNAERTVAMQSDAGAARRSVDSEAPTMISDRSYPAQLPESAGSAASGALAAANFHYVLLGTAGKGGMGTVHIAKDTELLRRVALKQLNPEADAVASARSRFLREVQITAQLDHPNIVPVYALEVAPDGTPAYTMKFVEGQTFHTMLNEARDFFEDKRRPDETRALPARIEHFLKVCDAMAYAHDKGVIHRDLKPANLMLGRHNEVYVMDWGLCRALRAADEIPADRSVVLSSADISGGASETQIGDVVGTPKYMSPEQAQGHNRDLDARSDQCALGLILFELVTLKAPYDGRNAYEVLVNAAAGKRRPVVHAYLGRRISRDLVAIIHRATTLSPDQRYENVAELAADLRRYLRGDAVQARADNLWQRMQRSIARNRQRVLTGILALIAVAAIAVGSLLWQNQKQFVAERLREQRLLQLRDGVATAGDRVQLRMLQLEGAMQNLADSVTQIDEFGRQGEERFYFLREFKDPALAPTQMRADKRLGGRISLRWPVWTLPAGMTEAEALPTIRKLSQLQHFRRDLYHRAAEMIKNAEGDLYTTPQHTVADDAENNPLTSIAIALDNGIHSRFPGWDGLPDNYDPREHPWYKIAAGKAGPQWGDPYLSSVTRQVELPLSVPLYDQRQRFAGVVSALLSPDLIVHSLLELHGVRGISGVYLLDGRGHVLAWVGQSLIQRTDAVDESADQLFPAPELLRRLKAGETGILETTMRGHNVVIASDDISPMGWNVVAVADPEVLLNASAESAVPAAAPSK